VVALSDVLVVEDNEDLRDLFAEALREGGYEVDVAAGSREAAAYLRECIPRVILLDLMMPTENGVDLTAELRRDPRLEGVRVILVSGAVNLRAHAVEMGAADYVTKPVDADRLLEVVGRHLRRP
jgi:DNA-binding response OmpR family regulator